MRQIGWFHRGTHQPLPSTAMAPGRGRRRLAVLSVLAFAATGLVQLGVGPGGIPVVHAASTIVAEDFETEGEGSRYTSNTFDLGGNDYFERSAIPHPGFSSATPLIVAGSINGSSAWASEDPQSTAAGGNGGVVRLDPVDVSGFTGLEVTVAYGMNADNNLRWEDDDEIVIEYLFDDPNPADVTDLTGYTAVSRFIGDAQFGGELREDTDLNGTADGGAPTVTTTMTDHTFSIPSSGTNLSLQIRVETTGSTEEFVFDNIRITGTAAPSNQLPVLAAIEGADITYTESDPAVQVTNTITVSDGNDTTLDSATIQISAGNDPSEDVLAASPPAGITALAYVPATGALQLTGTATLADYQTALRSVTYDNTDDDDPSAAQRTVRFQVVDSSGGSSNLQTRNIGVVPTIGTGTIPHTDSFETNGEGERYESNEFEAGGSTGIFDRVTGQPSQFADAVTSVDGTFYWAAEQTGNAANPLGGDTGYLKLLDLDSTGLVGLQVDVALVMSNDNNLRWENNDKIEVQYAFDGSIGSSIDTGTYVTIGRFIGNGTNIVGGDLIADADLNGTADAGGTELTTALQDFTYSIPGTGSVLSVRVVVESDGSEEVAFDHIRVTGTADPNIAPTLANLEGSSVAYTEEDPATQLTNTITVADVDDTDIEGATVQVTSNLDPSEDVLALTSPPAGITVDAYIPATGLLTLSGAASMADYQTALRAVTYENTDANDPSGATRTVTFQVDDGTAFSNMVTRDVDVTPVIGTGTLPHVESFEAVDGTHGEGESYESNEFDAGGSAGIFDRVTGQPSQFADAITSVDGTFYWAGEQTGNAANPLGGNVGYLKLLDLDSTGLSDLEVEVALAAGRVGEGRWEANDKIEVQYAFDGDIGASIDTGTYTTIGRYVGTAGELAEDTDLDGVGDGSGLTAALTDVTFPIAATGSLLSIRIVVDSDGTEEVAFDNIRVGGAGSIVEFSQATYSVGEDGTPSGAAVSLTRTGNLALDASVQVNLTDGTATAGADYTGTPIVVDFTGSSASETVNVPITQDAIVEVDETIDLEVVSLDVATQIDPQNTATLTILDDDSADVGVSGTSDGDETGPVDGVFTVSQSAQSSSATVLGYSVGGSATSGSDFTALSGSVTIPAGSTEATITVPVIDDAVVEAGETVMVTLDGITSGDVDVSIDGASDSGSITISDDDSADVGVSGTSDGDETGPVDGVFTVSQSAQSSSATVLGYSVGGSATSGSDFTALSGSVTIPAGSTEATITVPVIDDAVVEAGETVMVTLDGITSGDVDVSIDGASDSASLTIFDDDTTTLTITGVSQAEGTGGTTTAFNFSVTLGNAVAGGFDVAYTTDEGTATLSDSDFVDNDGSLSFSGSAGEVETVTVLVNHDAVDESDETFTVSLGALSGLAAGVDPAAITIVGSPATGEILDDDSAPIPDADGPYVIDEGDPLTLDGSGSSDPDGDPMTFRWDVDGDGDFDENVTGVMPTLTWAQLVALGISDGPYSDTVTVEVSDGLNVATDSSSLAVDNLAPAVAATPLSQMVQYSDPIADVTITATDVAADTMNASTTWSVNGGAFTAGLPDSMTIAGSLALTGAANQTSSATWTLSGVADLAPGSYVIRVAVTDDDGGAGSVDVTIDVEQEDAGVEFDSDNSLAVQVASEGGNSGIFMIDVTLSDASDGFPGDIEQATLAVSLEPVGPGSPVGGTCTTSGSGVWSCSFDDVPVNTYVVVATVGGFYTGSGEDVLVVFDPSLGFSTGGGSYVDADSGDRVTFAYTVKFNKKLTNVKGNLVVIRHTDEGVYRLKSNKIDGLAVGSGSGFNWASFTGKATYKEPAWVDAVGNYEFAVYVEDHGTPGKDADRFWLTAQRGGVVAEGLSTDGPAVDTAATLVGGNIVVPHQSGGGNGNK